LSGSATDSFLRGSVSVTGVTAECLSQNLRANVTDAFRKIFKPTSWMVRTAQPWQSRNIHRDPSRLVAGGISPL
jgi:hypothetical protein